MNYDEFEIHMKEKFPRMFSVPFGGIAVGKGWWPIIEILCANIQSHIDFKNEQQEKYQRGDGCEQVVVRQIKEKFGGLRFYYNGGNEKIDGMVRMAECWAARSCEECGAIATQRSGGWVRTLCDIHEAEYQQRLKERNED